MCAVCLSVRMYVGGLGFVRLPLDVPQLGNRIRFVRALRARVRAGEAKLCVPARRRCFRGWVSKRAFVLGSWRALAYLVCVLLKIM